MFSYFGCRQLVSLYTHCLVLEIQQYDYLIGHSGCAKVWPKNRIWPTKSMKTRLWRKHYLHYKASPNFVVLNFHTTLENREAQPVDTICNLQKQPVLFGQHLHSLMYSSSFKVSNTFHEIGEIESLKHQWWVFGIWICAPKPQHAEVDHISGARNRPQQETDENE
jgi:hypothetical protein